MSDMLWIALSTDKDIEFKSNIYRKFFKENKNKFKYPSIHTLYHVDNSISDKDLDNKKLLKLQSKYYEYIVYPSIRRCSKYFDEVIKIYDSNKIISIDGEDDPA